jgi:hypothetical protein
MSRAHEGDGAIEMRTRSVRGYGPGVVAYAHGIGRPASLTTQSASTTSPTRGVWFQPYYMTSTSNELSTSLSRWCDALLTR